jgi:hypothetical protein
MEQQIKSAYNSSGKIWENMKILFFALIISFTTMVYGQNKINGSYKLIAIKNKTTNALDSSRQEHALTINFETDTTVTLQLRRNTCLSSYHQNNENINLLLWGCTKVCCDTKIDQEVYEILGKVDRARTDKNELILESLSWALYFIRI